MIIIRQLVASHESGKIKSRASKRYGSPAMCKPHIQVRDRGEYEPIVASTSSLTASSFELKNVIIFEILSYLIPLYIITTIYLSLLRAFSLLAQQLLSKRLIQRQVILQH